MDFFLIRCMDLKTAFQLPDNLLSVNVPQTGRFKKILAGKLPHYFITEL